MNKAAEKQIFALMLIFSIGSLSFLRSLARTLFGKEKV